MKKLILFILAGIISHGLYAQKRTNESAGYFKLKVFPQAQVASEASGFESFTLKSKIDPLSKAEEKDIRKTLWSDEKNDRKVAEAAGDTLYVLQQEYFNTVKKYFVPKGSKSGLEAILDVSDVTVSFVADNLKELEARDVALKVDFKAPLTVKMGSEVVFEKDMATEDITNVKKIFLAPFPFVKKDIIKAATEEERMQIAQEFVNDYSEYLLNEVLEATKVELIHQYGTVNHSVHCNVYSAKGKKGTYDELDVIQEELSEKMSKLSSFSKKKRTNIAQVSEVVENAIPVWEKFLAEADYDNEKAKINADIADGLNYNCAIGYLILEDYQKAYEYIKKIKKSVEKNPFITTGRGSGFGSEAKYIRRKLEAIIKANGKFTVKDAKKEI